MSQAKEFYLVKVPNKWGIGGDKWIYIVFESPTELSAYVAKSTTPEIIPVIERRVCDDLRVVNKHLTEHADRHLMSVRHLEAEREQLKLDVEKYRAAHSELSKVDHRFYGDLILSEQRLRDEVAQLKTTIRQAVKYLKMAKKEFAPHTTNSDVDCFLEKHSDAKGSQ